ncbi:hypothetical protein GOARA_056_02140 [Gordonia araii NBRC 100433]|uniref:Polyketide cyclase/dehydrase n=1 Tax=Gordonia araii NBRC 100433 TaxID=1073574 RepID=G7H3P1_9ACTN|nr:SRPBCC family protein [Gordonia araii]NNG96581.1 SRPBCC family protein [Gordonia araii NBRC 100433]GAB10466.1 hypothetical protein GOARA_056_02140 [Gordonia araii NBRC 100433]
MVAVTVEKVINAPREVVYDVFTDREHNGDYLPINTRLVTPGKDARQGVGAVHLIGLGPVGIKEQIVELVPNERMVYKIVAGAPVKSHVGTVSFADAPNGTLVTYTMDSTPKVPVPAPALKAGLKALINQMLGACDKAAKAKTSE